MKRVAVAPLVGVVAGIVGVVAAGTGASFADEGAVQPASAREPENTPGSECSPPL
jgi:hypothetical protein